MFELNLDINHFLDIYWQKKPLLIKQGFLDFQDPIMPDEIAGLAMEEEIESRLVYRDKQGKWQAEHGPFSSFEKLEEDATSLLIQAVDHWHSDAQQLIRPFRFLPNWRLDDLMISYSTKNGGVGPHIDNYDVFIIQGLGKRHWRVGAKNKLKEFTAHSALKHCEAFSAILDVELEPGDILYIPVGFPHEGYAIEPSINYSVGFRAPDQNDLLSSFTDHCLDEQETCVRYIDKEMQHREKPGKIERQELTNLHEIMLKSCKTPEQLMPWLGKMLSESVHDLDIAICSVEHSNTQILEQFNEGAQFTRLGGLRAIYFEQDPDFVYINGTQYNCEEFNTLGHQLCDQDEVGSELIELLSENENALIFFTYLVNSGYWYTV
ncbi:cupin domain-containing protein [Psychromonas sp. CD1]|uniref:cupin domain-containing protein n=1 Tax=Psychromonas sp. CD1 TaxID=1979839 RepID=UPI000B9A99CD|nr:cupin domain-containing protein [Psychromonas sp. CD1]